MSAEGTPVPTGAPVIDGAPLPWTGPLLEVRDLRTSFRTPRGLVRAVDGVSFSLQRGQTLGVVGESGSGKSVLSRSIMGLLASNAVRSGEVLFEGRDISDLSPAAYRELWGAEMAMVFQDPMTALNPVMKVGRQITESLRFHLGMSKSEARETAVSLLRAVKIPEPEQRFDTYPHEMSGGMRQRVVIAVALACGPKLLLADEPTTALDVTIQAQILDLLRKLQADTGMALLMITHDLGVVAEMADDVAVMYAGRVVEQAPVAELFAQPSHPYTQGLFASLPAMSTGNRLNTIPGAVPPATRFPQGCRFHPRCTEALPNCSLEYPPVFPVSGAHTNACWLGEGNVK